MRPVKKVLSLLLVLGMMILIPAGPLVANAEMRTEDASVQTDAEETAAVETAEGTEPGETAEETGEKVSSEQKETPEMTEEGHIDGERLKLWLENYLKEDHWDEPQCSISVAFWYPASDETWLYNPDEWIYGVNWSKLPVSMYFAEQLANGKLSNDSVITGIQLEYALQTVLENSSGPSFYSMVSHLGGNTVSNCAELVPQYAGLPEDYYTDDFYQRSYYTARIMMEVTKTLYQGGDERFPKVLEYMKASQPWDMFNRDDWIRNDLHTSQTHAASWGDGAGDYLHCTGVIYTNNPFVLTVMMKNISDLDIMGGIAHHFCVLAQSMGYRQEDVRKAKETAAAEKLAETKGSDEPDASPGTATDAEVQASELPTDSATAQDNPPSTAKTELSASEQAPEQIYLPTPRILLLAASALILLLLIVVAAFQRNRMKSAPPRKATRSGREK